MPSSKQDGRGTKSPVIPRGFASMDPERQREVASEGGRNPQEQGADRGARPQEARGTHSRGDEAAGGRRKPEGGGG